MEVLKCPDGFSTLLHCGNCDSQLRVYAGDIKVQTFAANPSEASFKCVACGTKNLLRCPRHTQTGKEVIEHLNRT